MTAYTQADEKPAGMYMEAASSPFAKYSAERRLALVALLPPDSSILKFHQSLCPGCVEDGKFGKMLIDAVTYARKGKVWISKRCEEHGIFRELSWSDFSLYKRAERYQDAGIRLFNPEIDNADISCPLDCGLCSEHESHTGLGNIVVTNRCDINCWYCFFYAKEGEPVYEPTQNQIEFMLRRLKNEKPISCNSVQFTGGEPTLRDDIADIVRIAKELNYDHIQLNTNGINLARNPQLAPKLREAGISNLYMSFDGVTPQTNPKNYWEVPAALDNCHKAGIGVVLVPTVIGGVNDHEIGDIVRFALDNLHAVRGTNFQPVSLVGRMPEKMRKSQRITIPGTIKRIEEQMDGQIGREDFFTVPCAKNITDFLEAVSQRPKYRLSVHFQCGMATYAFKDGDNVVPITRFFDVEGFFEYLSELTNSLRNGRYRKISTTLALTRLALKLGKFVDDEKKPKNLNFKKIMRGAIVKGDFKALADFHNNALFIGMMHFQDPYNWDIDRIHKCDIHYAVPDGRILPFCTFNVIPELYRDSVQRRFSVPAENWEKKTGKKLADDMYVRGFTEGQMREIRAVYDKCRKAFSKPELEPDWGSDEIEEDEFLKAEIERKLHISPGEFNPKKQACHRRDGCGFS